MFIYQNLGVYLIHDPLTLFIPFLIHFVKIQKV